MQSFFYDEKLLVNADGTPTVPPATPSVKTDKADVASTPTSTLKRESLPPAGIVASSHSIGSKCDKRPSHSSPSQAGAGPEAGDSVEGGAAGELKWDGDDELDALVDMVDMEVEGQLRLAFLVHFILFLCSRQGLLLLRDMNG